MDKKSLKVNIYLNFFGTYKKVRQVADITSTSNVVKIFHACYSQVAWLKKQFQTVFISVVGWFIQEC